MLTANSSDYDNNHVCEEFCEDSVKIARGDSLEYLYEKLKNDTPVKIMKRYFFFKTVRQPMKRSQKNPE